MRVEKDMVLQDGIITVICGDKARTYYGEDKTLDECLNIAAENAIYNTVLVIHEWAMSGRLYRYGNHGTFWEQIGQTEGYA